MAVAVAAPVKQLLLHDFSGGLNLRDSPDELASNETPSSVNWTLDLRAALRVRNGNRNAVTLPGVGGKAAYIWYSEILDQWLCARETFGTPNTVHLWTRPGDLTTGAWTDRGSINPSLSSITAFVDWPGNPSYVVFCSAPTGTGTLTGGIFTWDGTTLVQRSTNQAGHALAVWQNAVWMAGYPVNDANGNLTRLFRSKVGDPTNFTPPDGVTVDIRDSDRGTNRLTGLGLAGGALMVFKKRSAHRVNNLDGSYSTIDSSSGCVGPLAVVPQRGRLYTWGADSLYGWDGVGPGKKVGDKVRPLFATDAALVGGVPTLAGGIVEDRCLFAYPTSLGGIKDGLLEFDPEHGWLMKHTWANRAPSQPSSIDSFTRKGADLYGASGSADLLYQMFSDPPGADDAHNYTSTYLGPWLRPFSGKRFRVMRAEVDGKLEVGDTNVLNVFGNFDFIPGQTWTQDISALLRTANDQGPAVLRSLGQGIALNYGLITANLGSAEVYSLALDLMQLEY